MKKSLTTIAKGAIASTSYQRLPALIDISIRPAIETERVLHSSYSLFPSRSPWMIRQSSTNTGREGYNKSVTYDNLSSYSTIEREVEGTNTLVEDATSITSLGSRRRRRNADYKELKDISEGTALALLRVLGLLNTGTYSDIGRTFEYTKELTKRRYPDMNPSQVNLQAILVNLLRMSHRNGNRILPEELIRIHKNLVNERKSICEKLVKSVLSLEVVPKEMLPEVPICQESLQSFKTLLKHSHRYNKTRLFQVVRNEARHFYFNKNSQLLHSTKERIKRQAEMEQVDLMIQSLLLSSSAKRAFHHNLTRRSASLQEGRMRSTSSMQSIFKSHNDIYVMSKILRTRYGALKPRKNQTQRDADTKIEYRLSNHAANSPHPPLHQSRRTRKVNRLVQRAMSGAHMPKLRPDTMTAKSLTETKNQEAQNKNVSHKLLKTVKDTFPSFPSKQKENENVKEMTEESTPILEGEVTKMNIIDREVRAWKENVRLWHLRRANVTRSLSRVAAESSKEEDGEGISVQNHQQAPLLPTWLFSAALQAHVETGRPRLANHIVQLYLKMLYQSKGIRSDELVQIIPVGPYIVRMITNPLNPPRSEMILNALLRVQLMSGKVDAWECMLSVIEKWCSGGKGFADQVRERCGMKSVERSNILEAHRDLRPHEDEALACLHPNEASVLLLLESLRSRKGRMEKAKAVIKEAFLRWGHKEILPACLEPFYDNSPKGYLSTFVPTTRTFRDLLQLVFNSSKFENQTGEILDLIEEWLENFDIKALHSNSNASKSQIRSLMFHRDLYKARQEQSKWNRVIQKGLKKGFISSEKANEILQKSMYKF